MDLVNKFLATIHNPELQEGKYDWLDAEKAVKPVSSASKINAGDDAGKKKTFLSLLTILFDFNYLFTAFKEIDRNAPIDLSVIHNDCIEMFAYFNAKVVDCLVKCTKYSLDVLKKRATAGR